MAGKLAYIAAAAVALAPAAAAAVTFLHTPAQSARAGGDLAISGNVFGGGDLERLEIRYRLEGDTRYRSQPLELDSGDLWRGTIPGADLSGGVVEYYILGVLADGREEVVFATSKKPQRVPISGRAGGKPPSADGGGRGRGRPPRDPGDGEGSTPVADRGLDPDGARDPARDPDRDRRAGRSGGGRGDGSGDEPADPDDEGGGGRRRPAGRGGLSDELALFGSGETVTIATLSETPVGEAPAIASVIGRAELRAFGYRTVFDALKALPGFETSRDVQGNDRVAIRGIRSDPEILVLYDGHKLNNSYDARALLRIPAENVERIEVIRGPGSALYGAGAFLGVVNIVSRRAEGIALAGEGASRPAFGGHGQVGLAGERLSLHLDVNARQGWPQGKDVDEDALTVNGDLQRQGLVEDGAPVGTVGDAGLFLNAGARGALQVGTGGEASLSLRVLRDERTPLIGAFDSYGADRSEIAWLVLLADLGYRHELSDAVALEGRASFDLQTIERSFSLAPPGVSLEEGATVFPEGPIEETTFSTQGLGVSTQGTFQLADTNTLTAGVSFSQESLTDYAYGTNFEGDTPLPAVQEPEGIEFPQKEHPSRQIIGAFLQDQWRVVEPLSLTVGARVDSISDFDPAVSPRVGLVWGATRTTTLKLLYGSAFRAPTFQELTDRTPNSDLNQGRFEGNADLKPVTITTFEAGISQLLQAVDAKIRVRGDVFYNLFRNRIEAVDTTGNLPPLQNRDTGVDVFGAELEARVERSARAFSVFNFSWFRARDNNPDIPVELHLLTDVPQYRLNVGSQLPVTDVLDASALLQLASERRSNARSRLETLRRWQLPAYALLTVQVSTQEFGGGWSVAAIGENVLDEDYRDDVGRPDRVTGQLPRDGITGWLVLRKRFAP